MEPDMVCVSQSTLQLISYQALRRQRWCWPEESHLCAVPVDKLVGAPKSENYVNMNGERILKFHEQQLIQKVIVQKCSMGV